jgi:hypothetical protein
MVRNVTPGGTSNCSLVPVLAKILCSPLHGGGDPWLSKTDGTRPSAATKTTDIREVLVRSINAYAPFLG